MGLPSAGPPAHDAIGAFVQAEMERQRVPGLALAVIPRSGEADVRACGLANVEHEVVVTPETVFQSGSTGKQLTAALVMLLVEDGVLALDAPIAVHLPEAPSEMRAVTLRHLLTHTSGIPDYDGSFDVRRAYTEAELLGLTFAQKLEFPPGTRWRYSNRGYALLGLLMGRVTGAFYGNLLVGRILSPLGMKTARVISERDIVRHRAAGYVLRQGALENQDWVSPELNTTADGALYFSITDLLAWDRALREGALLKPSSWAEIYAPARLASGRTVPYGFGWMLGEASGHPVRRHAGAWQGFKADVLRYPEDGLTVMVLCNLADADPERFTDGVVRILAPALARPRPAPIEETDPARTARIAQLLEAAASGTLSHDELTHVRASFFTDAAPELRALLGPLGALSRLEPVQREERGDDLALTYLATYGAEELSVAVAFAPDGGISELSVGPRRG